MPFTKPTLSDLRKLNRDKVSAGLGSGALVPNSILRILADGNAGLAYSVFEYVDWLSKQLLPDTAEGEWLRNRHASIWLDSVKQASYASGTLRVSGTMGAVVPKGARLLTNSTDTILEFQTTESVTIGVTTTVVQAICLNPGAIGNVEPGISMAFSAPPAGVEQLAVVDFMSGGADAETDDELRVRVLDRIRKPPMGGDADDFVAWALEVPGVTRAWCAPLEMGVGTVTVRFMMDDLRATSLGFPNYDDVKAVQDHVNLKRPVAVKDCFVSGPLQYAVNIEIKNLYPDDASTRANIEIALVNMLFEVAKPGHALNGVTQPGTTIYAAWINEAIMNASGVDHFELVSEDQPMPTNGHLAVLGTVIYSHD